MHLDSTGTMPLIILMNILSCGKNTRSNNRFSMTSLLTIVYGKNKLAHNCYMYKKSDYDES